MYSWLGVLAGLLIMAGGHSFNSFLDYAWTGLDKGKLEDRSAEKDYTGGQNLIANGVVSVREVAFNAIAWYILALIPLIYLSVKVGWPVLLIAFLGMLMTFWYSKSKFNWTHEFALGTAAGPLPVLVGMFATSPDAPLVSGLLASVPFAIILSFFGLAMDEWPDAEANLKKGVRSIAYKVWENGVSLEWYLSIWLLFMFLYQTFVISIKVLAPLTALSFLTWPFFAGSLVLLAKDFRRVAGVIVIIGAVYALMLPIGQALGR